MSEMNLTEAVEAVDEWLAKVGWGQGDMIQVDEILAVAAPLIEKAALQRVLGSEDDPTGILDRFTVACAPNDPGGPLFFWHCDRCNVVHVIARDLDGDQSGVTLAEMAESAMAHEEERHAGEVTS